MRSILAAVWWGLLAFGVCWATPTDEKAFDIAVKNSLETWRVPGAAIAVVRDDTVVYLKGHGVKELGQKDPITPDTLFPLASCTKGFTTTAMAMLVDEGKMAWDDPVRKHLDYFRLADPAADAQVTLRDLVTHRTGVRGHDLLWYRAPWSQEESIRRIGRVKLDRPFRGSFQYQSTMFTAAGHAVAATAKTSWGDFVRQRILRPLDMTGVTLTTADAEKAADHASGHRKDSNGEVEGMPWYRIEVPDPAGSICASASDLTKWLRFHLNGGTFEGKRLVSMESLAETHTPQNIIRLEGSARATNPDALQMSYGMAWVVHDYRGHLLIEHAGLIDGFRAHLTLLPNAKAGVVVLTNLHQTRMNLALSNRLVDLLLGLPAKDWNRYFTQQVQQEEEAAQAQVRERLAKRHRNTQPSRELAAYAGTYEEPAYGKAEVVLRNGTLVWNWSSFSSPLHHFHYDTFLMENEVIGNPRVTFTLGPDGEVATMKVVDVMDVEFRKVRRNTPPRKQS